ncbi:hypothetical protein FB446DRAFT_758654 [Lentinula raphanica]|nr:hypothetical protein FB446DRAFT_758654 [Lentinula raphanica]
MKSLFMDMALVDSRRLLCSMLLFVVAGLLTSRLVILSASQNFCTMHFNLSTPHSRRLRPVCALFNPCSHQPHCMEDHNP